MPKRAIADSACGSEENYTYCEKKQIVVLIKYNTLDREQTKVWAKEIGRIENMTYDEELDEWICAKGERLVFVYKRKETIGNGYVIVKRTYRCTACAGCPFQAACAKGKDTKTIRVSLKNQQQRQEIRKRLSTEEGAMTYRRRQIENEPVFGQIKHNQQFQRFLLRGLPKITVEWGLICAAHNLKKWAVTTDPTRKKQDKIRR
ncbi:transposase [Parageobacillus thermoglucosidasius]|uniref:transposase n=2 Tax=Parageobacillus thermoglucosidasius TaxID=1426 RepID=UPI0005F79BAC